LLGLGECAPFEAGRRVVVCSGRVDLLGPRRPRGKRDHRVFADREGAVKMLRDCLSDGAGLGGDPRSCARRAWLRCRTKTAAGKLGVNTRDETRSRRSSEDLANFGAWGAAARSRSRRRRPCHQHRLRGSPARKSRSVRKIRSGLL